MNGIKFGEVHSFEDLNLILSKVDLPPAAVKTVFVDNPGGDGSWDLTEANGKVNYKDRTAKFTFSVLPEDDFEAKKTEVSNLLNGRRFKITLDKDPEYYWDGRCTVDQYSSNKKMRQIVVGASVAPYKLKQEKTSVFVPFCGKNLLAMPAPKTTSSKGVTWEITDDGSVVGSGTPTEYSALSIYGYNDGFVLGKGKYTLSFSGICENVSVDIAIRKADGTIISVINSKPMPIVFAMPETNSIYLAVKRLGDKLPVNMDCFLQTIFGLLVVCHQQKCKA